MGILEKKVTPNDCLLAITLPLTKEEFLADLTLGAAKDYARFYSSLHWDRPDQDTLWSRYRDNFCNLVESVALEVERLGVKVVRKVKLADLSALLSEHEVITLLSHWRGANIETDDFLCFTRFVDQLKDSQKTFATSVKRNLSTRMVTEMDEFDPTTASSRTLQGKLIQELNSLLDKDLREQSEIERSRETPLPAIQQAYFNRIALESAFAGELRPGNRMEFFDGLQSVEAIQEQIPNSFAGLLDLIVCNSVLPAEAFKVKKRNCLIISSQFPAKPSFRLLLYKATIKALQYQAGSFVDTMMKVREGLGNYLRNHE